MLISDHDPFQTPKSEVLPINTNDPSQRQVNQGALIFLSVSLIPLVILIWVQMYSHGFKDWSDDPTTAMGALLNCYGVILGLFVSSFFLGLWFTPRLSSYGFWRALLNAVFAGIVWSVPTFAGVWCVLSIYGAFTGNFGLIRQAFTFREIAPGFVILPLFLNIPLASLGVFLIRKIVFRYRPTA